MDLQLLKNRQGHPSGRVYTCPVAGRTVCIREKVVRLEGPRGIVAVLCICVGVR